MNFWVDRFDCQQVSRLGSSQEITASRNPTIFTEYSDCEASKKVSLWRIENAPHTPNFNNPNLFKLITEFLDQ